MSGLCRELGTLTALVVVLDLPGCLYESTNMLAICQSHLALVSAHPVVAGYVEDAGADVDQ